MNSNFSINYVFEEDLVAEFSIIDGIFTTNNEQFILQHLNSIQNLKTLDVYEDITNGEDANNYFEKSYRYSSDSINWSNWFSLTNGEFAGFPNEYTNDLIWIQVRYVFISDETKEVELTSFKFFGTRTIDEIFEPAVLEPGEPVVYTNQDTYKVFELNDFEVYIDDNSNINNLDIKFRFTQTQGRRWTDWTNLTSDNLKELEISKVKFANFQFAFHNTGTSNIQLFDLELLGEFQNITANYKTIAKFGLKSQCNPLAVKPSPTDCVENDNKGCAPLSEAITPWNNDIENCSICSDGDYINLNDKELMTPLIQLNQQMNEFINSVNSWKATYLLTDPDGKGIDHVLHEQQIHNVIAKRDINIIIPDNQFPTGNVSFNGFDLDLIQTFEVHILKPHFKSVFGLEFRPGKRDVIYICDINELWEVEHQFPAKSFMNAKFYYRVILKKFNKNSSRDYANTTEGQEAKDFVEQLTNHTTLDSMFFSEVDDEQKKVTKSNDVNVNNPSQQNTHTTDTDIRMNIDDNVVIKEDIVYNASLKVIKTYYEMPIKSKGIKLVEYNNKDNNVSSGQNRAVSLWFKTQDYNPTYDYSLLSNYDYDNNLGYKLNIFQGSLDFTWNGTTYNLPIAQKMENDIWYSILVNYDQSKEKCEIAIYKRQNENGITLNSSKLILVQKKKYTITTESFKHDENIFIGGVDTFNNQGNNNNWYISNIRIYNEVVNNRHVVLNENVVSDADLTELVDNARKDINLPNYGNL